MDALLKDLLDNWDDHIKIIRTGYVTAQEPPQAKQSTQFGKGRAFTPKKKREYLKKLASEFKTSYHGVVIRGKIRLTVLFCFPFTVKDKAMRTLGWALTDKHVDVDNLLKPCSDVLSGLIYGDDHQVVEVRARKIRYDHGMIAIRIDEIGAERL